MPGSGCAPEPDASGRPPVVLVTLESLRTDHVGAYGGASGSRPELPLTPALDALAAGATVYEQAQSVTSWTLTSHASLFTGLYPTAHGTEGPRDCLDESYTTLAERLDAAGYRTAGVISGPYLRPIHQLDQGFDHYDDTPASITNALAHDDVTNPAMEQALQRVLDEPRDPRRPLFLFAYFWDPALRLPAARHPTTRCSSAPDCEPLDAARTSRTGAADTRRHARRSSSPMDLLPVRRRAALDRPTCYLGRLLRAASEASSGSGKTRS